MAPRFFVLVIANGSDDGCSEEKTCYALEVALAEAKAAILNSSRVSISDDSGQVLYTQEQLTQLFACQRLAYKSLAVALILFAVTIVFKWFGLPASSYQISFSLTMVAFLVNAVAWGSFVVLGNRARDQS